jgi:hypothetical protein
MTASLSHKWQILPYHILFPAISQRPMTASLSHKWQILPYHILFPAISHTISHKLQILPYHILFLIITLLILHIGLQIKNQFWYTMYKQKTKTIYNVLLLN